MATVYPTTTNRAVTTPARAPSEVSTYDHEGAPARTWLGLDTSSSSSAERWSWCPVRPAGRQGGQVASRGRSRGDAARSSMAGGEMAIGRLTTSARGRACLKLSPTWPCWRCFPEIEVLVGASSSSTRGSEFSSYSTSMGRVELNNSTITRLRATHRGQCRIAVRHGRTSMLRPHRGQFRCPQQMLTSTCVLVLMSPPTGLGRRRGRSATPVVWRRTRSEAILCGRRWPRSFGERRAVGRWWR